MSDVSQGPGWWQASDGKWYPPEQAAGAAPAAAPAGFPPAGPPPGSPPAGYGIPGPTYGDIAGGGAPAYGAPVGGPAPGQLADWVQRFLAYLVDGAIIFVAYIAIFILIAIGGAIADALGLLILIVGYLFVLAYGFYILFLTGETGQSPGKAIIGIKVVAEATGQPIGGGSGIVRGLAHIADSIICGIGYLFPLWDPKKQTLADKIMNTVVVNVPKRSFGKELFQKP